MLLGVLLTADRAFARFQLLLRSLLSECLLPAIRNCVKYRISDGETGPFAFAPSGQRFHHHYVFIDAMVLFWFLLRRQFLATSGWDNEVEYRWTVRGMYVRRPEHLGYSMAPRAAQSALTALLRGAVKTLTILRSFISSSWFISTYTVKELLEPM